MLVQSIYCIAEIFRGRKLPQIGGEKGFCGRNLSLSNREIHESFHPQNVPLYGTYNIIASLLDACGALVKFGCYYQYYSIKGIRYNPTGN